MSYIATLFHLVPVFLVLIVRERRGGGEGGREGRTLLESAGVHSLFPWRKNKEDLREHPRGMVHLVCVINVSRAFTYPPTLMIANVLFSVLLRRVWIPLPFFFFIYLFFLSSPSSSPFFLPRALPPPPLFRNVALAVCESVSSAVMSVFHNGPGNTALNPCLFDPWSCALNSPRTRDYL